MAMLLLSTRAPAKADSAHDAQRPFRSSCTAVAKTVFRAGQA